MIYLNRRILFYYYTSIIIPRKHPKMKVVNMMEGIFLDVSVLYDGGGNAAKQLLQLNYSIRLKPVSFVSCSQISGPT